MNRREFLKKSLEGIIVGSIPLISSCSKNPLKSEPELNSNSIIKDNIEYCMQTDKKDYELGENVDIPYKVTNLGSKEVKIHTYQSPEFNILIKKDGETIWAVYHGFWAFSPGVTLSADETLNNPRTWSIKNSPPSKWDMRYDESGGDNEGKLVEPGIYNVIFALYTLPRTEVGVPITIIKN